LPSVIVRPHFGIVIAVISVISSGLGETLSTPTVMAGLVPAIHDFDVLRL
jgi:hypothetical protein